MADDQLTSVLKTGFVCVGLLLAGILFVLINDRENAPTSVGPTPNPAVSPALTQSWTAKLETRCRSVHARMESIERKFLEVDRRFKQGRVGASEGMTEKALLNERLVVLDNELTMTCSLNQDLWEHLNSSW